MATTPSAISGVTATGASANAASTAPTTSLSNSSQDFNRFLTLLTAQMKYQDPMQPTDPTQFVAQLAQFSQVEQQTKSNTLLTSILGEMSGSLAQNAALIGKSVQTSVTSVTLPASGAAAAVKVSVPTTSTAKNLRIEVLDGNNTVVRSVSASKGETSFVFDGNNSSGTRLAAGHYTVRVVGEDGSNTRQSAGTITSSGKITEVRRDSAGTLQLALENGNSVTLADITRLTQ